MKQATFQHQDTKPPYGLTTITTAEISCPYCHQFIKMVVPDGNALLDYRQRADFLLEENAYLRQHLIQIVENNRQLQMLCK